MKASKKDVFTPLIIKLRVARCRLSRVIIYCGRCEECAELYHFFHSSLKQEFTEPVGAPNLAMFHLVDIYTGVTRKSIQDSIVTSFGTSHAPLRVVICTIAFGMGIDCVDVCQVIHWGPSSTSNHMFRSVVKLVEMVSHLMLYCFGKWPILVSKARKWNFIAEC